MNESRLGGPRGGERRVRRFGRIRGERDKVGGRKNGLIGGNKRRTG